MRQYSVILCDPPWEYDRKVGQGIAQDHYPTMSLADICTLPVADIAAKDSVLFMWVTFPMLREGLEVIRAWGFRYKTCAFTWVKTNPKAGTPFLGMGFWTRSNAEICLLATRGHPKRISNRVRQIIISPIRRHSQKPDDARMRIVELMGDVPRIELFAREAAPGWDVWGNEVECSIQFDKEGSL